MKRKTVFPTFMIAILVGCSSTTEDTPDDTTEDTLADETVFYDAVQLVAPSFAPENTSSTLSLSKPLQQAPVTTTWESGNPLYEVFYILREFNPNTDQGVIDTSNLYKTMWEAKGFFSDTKSQCTAITEQVITPPFDFGNDPTTYNCAYNQEDTENGYHFGGAVKELDVDGNILEIEEEDAESDEGAEETTEENTETSATAVFKYGLFGFVWASDHNEYGVLQGVLDTSTDNLFLDIAVWVDYEEENDYCYRNDIDGNTGTHLFTFRSIKGNRISGSSSISIVSKGYSEGEGKYFLLKVTSSDLDATRYYCIGANDSETELRTMAAEGSETVDANCAEYQEEVAVMTPFETTDLACETSDFNPGGTGTAAEGTIFLNYL